jgi:hypothetical protein
MGRLQNSRPARCCCPQGLACPNLPLVLTAHEVSPKGRLIATAR